MIVDIPACRHPVAILAYENSARVRRCVESILAAGVPEGAQLFVLDNGRDVKTDLAALPVGTLIGYRDIAGETRGGFTAALRWLLASALDGGHAETVTLLNDDIAVLPGCLPAMIAGALEPGIGLACPMQVAWHNEQVVICGGTGAAYPSGLHLTGPRGGDLDRRSGARWMPFAAVTFRAAAVRDVGLPDRNMRTWFSDSDYCIRMRLAGWAVLYLGAEAVVRHEGSASIRARWDADDPAAREAHRLAFAADQVAFARKWGGGILAEYST